MKLNELKIGMKIVDTWYSKKDHKDYWGIGTVQKILKNRVIVNFSNKGIIKYDYMHIRNFTKKFDLRKKEAIVYIQKDSDYFCLKKIFNDYLKSLQNFNSIIIRKKYSSKKYRLIKFSSNKFNFIIKDLDTNKNINLKENDLYLDQWTVV